MKISSKIKRVSVFMMRKDVCKPLFLFLFVIGVLFDVPLPAESQRALLEGDASGELQLADEHGMWQQAAACQLYRADALADVDVGDADSSAGRAQPRAKGARRAKKGRRDMKGDAARMARSRTTASSDADGTATSTSPSTQPNWRLRGFFVPGSVASNILTYRFTIRFD